MGAEEEVRVKAALAVPRLTTDLDDNLRVVEALTRGAARQGADLVLFPEMAPTGFVHTGEAEHDRALAQPVPGPGTRRLSGMARRYAIYLAIGLLERDGIELYDTALLFRPDGSPALKYRRISAGWHARDADPVVYRRGSDLAVAHTAIGSVAVLICGDITDDDLVDRVRALAPDVLLFPIARGFDDDVHDDREWEEQEIAFYGERVAHAGVPTLLVNYVGTMDGFIGGAVAYASDGRVLASHPLHQPGVLLVDVP